MIDLFVDVNLTSDQPALIRESFDTIGVLTEAAGTPFVGRSKTYERGELVADFLDSSKEFDIIENGIFAQNPRVKKVRVLREDAADAGNITTIYNAVKDEGFFVLIQIARGLADQKLLSALVEFNQQILAIGSDDVNIKDGGVSTDVASDAQTNSRDFTATFYDDQSTEPEKHPASLASRILGLGGSGLATWSGIANLKNVIASIFTSQEETDTLAKNANIYVALDVNSSATFGGKVASGKFIDSIRGRQELKSTVKFDIAQLIINTNKIPFTKAGIAMVVETVQCAAAKLEGTFLVAGESVVTFPDITEIDPTDKSNRILKGIILTVTEAGAIHTIVINIGVQI